MEDFPKRLMKITCKLEDFHFNCMYGKKFTIHNKNVVKLWNYTPIYERRKVIDVSYDAVFVDAKVGVDEVYFGDKRTNFDILVGFFNKLPKEVRRKAINDNKNLFFGIY